MNCLIGKRAILTFSLLSVLLLVDAWVSYRGLRQLSEDNRWMAHIHAVLDVSSNLLSVLRVVESGQRSYIITGGEAYPESFHTFHKALAQLRALTERLRRLTADHPAQQGWVAALEQRLAARLRFTEENIRLRRAQGYEAAQRMTLAGKGKREMEAIRAQLAELERVEQELLAAREGQSRHSYRVAMLNGLVATLLGLCLLGFTTPVVWRDLLRRARGARMGSSIDVTDRRRTEATLRESEERFRTLAAVAGDAAWDWNFINQTVWRHERFSDRYHDMTGIVDADGHWWEEHVHPEDRERVAAGLEAVISSGGQYWSDEYRFRVTGDDYGYVLDRGLVLRDETGRPVRMIGATLDITKLKQAEEALRRARDELDLRVQERTAALGEEILQRMQAEEALKEADRRKNDFLAMLAHELRNPLALIRNAVEVLKRLELREPKLQWVRDVIDHHVAHMTRLVHDLLDVSRITRGHIRLQKQPIELAAVIEQAVEASRLFTEARHHRFSVEIPPEPLYVKGDPTRLAQVLDNLLTNAAKYSEEGACIWLTVTRVDGNAVISVKDMGIGIAPEFLPHVFDLFMQGSQRPSRSRWGLGIGLTLVKRLVELHGGSVEAQSPGLGQGAQFLVHLPLLPGFSPAEMRETERQVQTEPTARLRVLVVDDHADVLHSTCELLNLMGHEVQTVGDGAAALHAARSFQPQVLLIDIELPGMDGYELARRLRAEPGTKQALFIAITGYGQETDARLTRAAGFDHYLVKPVDFAAIEALLNRAAGDRPAVDRSVSEDTEHTRVEDPLSAQQESATAVQQLDAAHEINQPLMAIMSYLEGARRMFHDVAQANPAFAEFLEAMARSTQRAVELVRVMRDDGRNAETGASTKASEDPTDARLPQQGNSQAVSKIGLHGDAL